jgi:hypothetical protein
VNIDKRHAFAFAVPAIVVSGLPTTTVSASESEQPETVDPIPPEPQDTEDIRARVQIPRPERGVGIASQLFERRDGEYELDPRLEILIQEKKSEQPQAMSYTPPINEKAPTSMQNPIPTGNFNTISDAVPRDAGFTDTIVRVADTAISSVLNSGQTEETLTTPIETSIVSQLPQTQNLSPLEASQQNQSLTPVKINGIEIGITSKTPIEITTTERGLFIEQAGSGIVNVETETPASTSNMIETTSTTSSVELINQPNDFGALVERVKGIAKPAGDGTYFMPDPVIENGKITYLFDKNTCNSERRGYVEHIAAVVAITGKYNELVSTKYTQYKDTVIDIGDLMSRVHIEHDEDSPAIDLRSRKISSPSGTYDGPAFVPNSPNFDVDFTVELLEYAQSLVYKDIPILKYVITADMKSLSEKTQHLERYYTDKSLMLFKSDHPEHVHLAFTVYDEIKGLPVESDFGQPCAVSGADFTEASDVTTVSSATGGISTESAIKENEGTITEENSSAMSSGYEHPDVAITKQAIIVDDPELIEFLRSEAENSVLKEQDEIQETTDTSPGFVDSISETVPKTVEIEPESIRIGDVLPTSELSRILNTGRITDGSRDASEIVDDLSIHSQKILNSIPAYAPVSPYDAASLRENNPGFSEYFPQLEDNDRQLSDREVLARAIVAHEIVFGERYGSEYLPDKIKSDVEKITAFSNRESLRYPGAVGDYKTESSNSGSSGLIQILNWDVNINPQSYDGVRDFDANLDPIQNLIHAFQMVDSNRAQGRPAFADWESGWKSDEGRRADMEIFEEHLGRIRSEQIYDSFDNSGVVA